MFSRLNQNTKVSYPRVNPSGLVSGHDETISTSTIERDQLMAGQKGDAEIEFNFSTHYAEICI